MVTSAVLPPVMTTLPQAVGLDALPKETVAVAAVAPAGMMGVVWLAVMGPDWATRSTAGFIRFKVVIQVAEYSRPWLKAMSC